MSYPSGPTHHRARWPESVVERARVLADQGKGYLTISRILKAEGYAVSWFTVRDWCAYRTRTRG